MEDMIFGVELLIIGMGTVVLSLYLLSVFLHFSGKFFGPKYISNKNGLIIKTEDNMKQNNIQKIKKTEKQSEATNQSENTKAVNPKKMAAISAAVYEMLSDKKNFKIISIRRNNNWKR
ncbi:MAG: OadG family protein [Halanaerobium sp.]